MRNFAKLVIVALFALVGLTMLVIEGSKSGSAFLVSAQEANTSPTPPTANANTANTATNAGNTASNTGNTASNTGMANMAMGDRKIPAEFILGQDSVSEYGEAPFNHDNHALKNYSVDGKSAIACIVCHHTDQPKSSLVPPLVTSERDVLLTMASYQASTFKVSSCRDCHFQEGVVPDDKEMPSIVFTKDGVEEIKEYNNEIAYHLNCNTCHDEAARLRPEVRKSPGFATTKECNICHVEQ